MLTLLAAILASPQAQPAPAPADLTTMVALYDEICLKTFPIDEQVDALMAKKGATALTPEQVKVTLHKGFAPQKPMDADMGSIHIHAETDFRALPGGTGEQLIVIAQTVADPARRAAGETGTELRFVHQIRAAR